MTESQFIEENKAKWKELEHILASKDRDPDKLHDLFVKVSSDLAYASTFYPKRSVRAYLNQLTQKVFDSMEEKKSDWSLKPIKDFFSHVLPIQIYKSRKAFIFSFAIFTIAVLIGVISSANNEDFLRVILGDDYVNMTIENINSGDPMAVYKGEEQSNMFFGITINNVRVSFLAFIFGIFGSLGTIIILLRNGIMLGAFQYFFYSKGLFVESFFTIWIHGTIEISAIIIAGAAGIVLGNGILFPGTYNRSTSMHISSKRAVRILVSTIPLFIIAGFLESFVTRLTGLPLIVKALIILASLLFILYIYVWQPYSYMRSSDGENEALDMEPLQSPEISFNKDQKRSFGDNLVLSLSLVRTKMGQYLKYCVRFVLPLFIAGIVFYLIYLTNFKEYENSSSTLLNYEFGSFFVFILLALIASFSLLIITMIYNKVEMDQISILKSMKRSFLSISVIVLVPFSIMYFLHPGWMIGVFLLLPPHFLMTMVHKLGTEGPSAWRELTEVYTSFSHSWGSAILGFGIVLLFHWIIVETATSTLGGFFLDFISWHEIFSGYNVSNVFINSMLYFIIMILILPMYYFLMVNQYYSGSASYTAIDLKNRFDRFGNKETIFE